MSDVTLSIHNFTPTPLQWREEKKIIYEKTKSPSAGAEGDFKNPKLSIILFPDTYLHSISI
jgi:hypothetical protein